MKLRLLQDITLWWMGDGLLFNKNTTMITAIPENKILDLLLHQLNNMFMLSDLERDEVKMFFPFVMEKINYCFEKTDNKYYHKSVQGSDTPFFNPYHSCQYTIFLYFYSRIVSENTHNFLLADKLYYLNKIMNNCDLFYQINLPMHWGCEHPCGSIMGRAKYGEGFFFYQCCTVGGNHGCYPIIGDNVWMFAHSQIIGSCNIGSNVKLGAGCLIKDQDIPANSLVFGQSPNLIIKKIK